MTARAVPLGPWGRWLTDPEVVIKRIRHPDGDRSELLQRLGWLRSDGTEWYAEPGLIYDGASIPRVAWGFSTSPWSADVLAAATIHDQYCKLGREGKSPYPSSAVHSAFFEIQRLNGVSAWRAQARYLAVRLFGPRFEAATME